MKHEIGIEVEKKELSFEFMHGTVLKLSFGVKLSFNFFFFIYQPFKSNDKKSYLNTDLRQSSIGDGFYFLEGTYDRAKRFYLFVPKMYCQEQGIVLK